MTEEERSVADEIELVVWNESGSAVPLPISHASFEMELYGDVEEIEADFAVGDTEYEGSFEVKAKADLAERMAELGVIDADPDDVEVASDGDSDVPSYVETLIEAIAAKTDIPKSVLTTGEGRFMPTARDFDIGDIVHEDVIETERLEEMVRKKVEEEVELTVLVHGEGAAEMLRQMETPIITGVHLDRGYEETGIHSGVDMSEPTVTFEGEALMPSEMSAAVDTDYDAVLERDSDAYHPGRGSRARELVDIVEERMEARAEQADIEYDDIDQLVLGEPQYDVLIRHMEKDSDAPNQLEDWFGVDQVIIVPGPQIHPVIAPEHWTET